MLFGLVLLAQLPATPDPTGIAGWAGAGLLGLVLYWLAFHHLPAKDRFLKEVLDAHAAQTAALVRAHTEQSKETADAHAAAISADRAAYQLSLDRVTAHCERELTAITAGLVEQLRTLHAAMTEQGEESRELHQQSRHEIAALASTIGLKLASGEKVGGREPSPPQP